MTSAPRAGPGIRGGDYLPRSDGRVTAATAREKPEVRHPEAAAR